jgi:hypothetical protein
MREQCGAETRRLSATKIHHQYELQPSNPEKRKKCPGGSAQPAEKARFGQGNPRQSKPFPLIFFAPAWLRFAGF